MQTRILQNDSGILCYGLILAAATLFLCHSAAGMAQEESDRDPTAVLRKEHDIIGNVAKEADAAATKIRKDGLINKDRILKFHDCFKNSRMRS